MHIAKVQIATRAPRNLREDGKVKKPHILDGLSRLPIDGTGISAPRPRGRILVPIGRQRFEIRRSLPHCNVPAGRAITRRIDLKHLRRLAEHRSVVAATHRRRALLDIQRLSWPPRGCRTAPPPATLWAN